MSAEIPYQWLWASLMEPDPPSTEAELARRGLITPLARLGV